MEKQISDLKQHKSNLGLFAGKRKKELQAQIDDLQVQADGYKATIEQEKAPIINDVTAKAAAVRQESMPTKVEISKLEAEKRDIQNELSRAR